MYKLPAMYVGEYAEQDAVLTLKLWQEMKKQMYQEDVEDVFNLETELFPCLVDMRFLGVRVDMDAAHKLKQELVTEEKKCLEKVWKETGVDVQIWAARSIEEVFKDQGLPYDKTAKTGAPSFTKNFLQNHPNEIVQLIARAREINKSHTTFIDTILKHSHNGRIHAEINQIRSDQGGTVTGRFSYNNPNLQQIPARNKELGPKIRSLFIPEEGCKWGCFDYSQQEPRLVVHFAILDKFPTVYDVQDAYKDDDVDFHQIVADMANIPRSQAKTINLGLFYGMGKNKLQAELGVDKEDAEDLFSKYHERVPFVKQLMYSVMERAQEAGKIRTLLGRRCRFNLWEPNQFGIHKALSHEEALVEHGSGIKRAYTYKALNRLIQGSAADMTKKAMVELHKEGIVPHIQVHDELDISVTNNADKIKKIMETAVKLEIDNKVDYESGPNWGTIK
jgi:DNA polymerase I-like protein with 3'-5' exonuclease and polymerase domains